MGINLSGNAKEARATGSVKFFNDLKGWGFITGDDGKDYFVHYKNIQSGYGKKTLLDGQKVTFVPEKTPKGVAAFAVVTE